MKLTITDVGMGLIAAHNDSISLVGGMRSFQGVNAAGTTRLKYIIQDNLIYNEMKSAGFSDSDSDRKCSIGFIELNIANGSKFDVCGLINIEINKDERKKGYAKTVINSILATIEKDLPIHDIKKHYASVWKKLGVSCFTNLYGEEIKVTKATGTINGLIPHNAPEKVLKVDSCSFSM